jgi:FkbM family methyltransferase
MPNLTSMRSAHRLYQQSRFIEAATVYRELADADPENVQLQQSLGRALYAGREPDNAAEVFATVTRLIPDNFEAWLDLGSCLLAIGETRKAGAALHTACRLAGPRIPNHRTVTRSAEMPEGTRDVPLWRGEPLQGKSLLIYSNQGVGDTIEWVRYLAPLRAAGAKIVLQCQPALIPLLRSCDVADEILARRLPAPACDYVVSMSSLFHFLKHHSDTPVKASIPYLKADPALVAHWRSAILQDGRLNVGLVWSGSPGHPGDAERSIPSVYFEPLLTLRDVRIYCLQIGTAVNDPLLHDRRCIMVPEEVEGFDRAAAAIEALDLVISVDTSLVHLAGALAQPVWLLLNRERPDPRWTPPQAYSPLYPTVEFFHQRPSKNWYGTIVAMAEKLKTRAQEYLAKRAQHTEMAVRPIPPPNTAPILATGHVQTKQCRYGLMSYYATDRYMGQSFDLYGEFSEGEVTLFRQVLRPGQTVLDVGANIGAHTVFFAHAVGQNGKVLAFEPQRMVFGLLCTNATLNNLAQIHPIHGALGDQAGTIIVPQFNFAETGNFGGLALGGVTAGEKVKQFTLDGLELTSCDFIKIDVEGLEAEVLQGGTATIRRFRPWLYVENDRKDRSAALIGRLKTLGYRLYWHLPPYFNGANYFGNTENVFGRTVSCNLLCLPEQVPQNIAGLREVTSTEEWPMGPR